MFTSILGILASALRIGADWMDGMNSADMVKQKKAGNIQQDKSTIEDDIAKGDVKAVGKDIS